MSVGEEKTKKKKDNALRHEKQRYIIKGCGRMRPHRIRNSRKRRETKGGWTRKRETIHGDDLSENTRGRSKKPNR